MNLITCEDLKAKIDSGHEFKLVMSYHENGYKMKHIPGSINIYSQETIAALLDISDEIVVHCINESCAASINAYHLLDQAGYENICRFAGGLQDWEEHGYPLEGDQVDQMLEPDNNFLINA